MEFHVRDNVAKARVNAMETERKGCIQNIFRK